MTVTETPSVVYHYTEEDLLIPEFSVNRHLNAVFEAAKKDLSTLIKLKVSLFCNQELLSEICLVVLREASRGCC